MTTFFSPRVGLSTLAISALITFSGAASAQNFEAALERGAQPDTTAAQRYQTAIREAGGGLKVAMEECRQQPDQRAMCEREARQNYKDDMAYARNLRNNPQARPTRVGDNEIRSTEVTTYREIPAK